MLVEHSDDATQGGREDRSALMNAYLAEYQAITTRNTYWLTLQYALFPILGAAIAVLAQMWDKFDKGPALSTPSHRVLIWLAIVLVNVIIIAHTEVGWESYDNVVYLETRLRPQILTLLSDIDEFRKRVTLGYETYKKEFRGKGAVWWEIIGILVSLVLLGGGVFLFGIYSPWTTVEWVAVPINVVLLIQVASVTFKMIRRRRDIGKLESMLVVP